MRGDSLGCRWTTPANSQGQDPLDQGLSLQFGKVGGQWPVVSISNIPSKLRLTVSCTCHHVTSLLLCFDLLQVTHPPVRYPPPPIPTPSSNVPFLPQQAGERQLLRWVSCPWSTRSRQHERCYQINSNRPGIMAAARRGPTVSWSTGEPSSHPSIASCNINHGHSPAQPITACYNHVKQMPILSPLPGRVKSPARPNSLLRR